MNFDDLRRNWQSQPPHARVTVDSALLLNEVRRNQRQFVRTIFWRDVREIGAAVIVAPFFVVSAFKSGLWLLVAPAVASAGVALFMLRDRWIQRKQPTARADSLRDCVEASLRQVRHQAWLLRNVFWWYLLPLGLSVELVFGWAVWKGIKSGNRPMILEWIGCSLACAVLYYLLYLLNQWVVRKMLEPRRQELQDLLSALDQPPATG